MKHLWIFGFLFMMVASKGLTCFDPSCYNLQDVIYRDVAIIGGGATGTYSSISLSDSGKQIVLIEKEPVLGGHTNTYTDPSTGSKVDYGVIAFWNTTVVQDFFTRLEVALGPVSKGATNETIYVDFQTGDVVNDIATSTNLSSYQVQLEKYPYLLEGWDLPNPVPEDLLLTFGEFVQKYSLQDLAFTLFNMGAAGGLVNILDQLTVTVLKADSLAAMEELNGAVVTTAAHDNSQLYVNARQNLGADILLNSAVISAQRGLNQSDVKLVVASPSGNKLIVASQLLVTVPLTLDNMGPFDLDQQEIQLFSHFQTTAYYCGLLSQPGLRSGVDYVNVGADTPYHIPYFPALYHLTPTALEGVYSFWYGVDGTINVKAEDEIKANISPAVKRLSGSDEPVDFIAFTSHTPFNLHVSAQDIAGGFYTRLNKLQGYRNTWYTGAVFTPSAATLWNFTKQLLPSIIEAL